MISSPDDAGQVAWFLHFSEKVPKDDVLKQALQIRVRGRSKTSGDRVLGRAIVKSTDLLFLDENNWTQFIGDVINRDMEIVGKYSVNVKYRPSDCEENYPEIPETHNISAPPIEKDIRSVVALDAVKSGVLEIFSISLSRLKSPSKIYCILL